MPVLTRLSNNNYMEGKPMVNMSYCRFENTLLALRECTTALENYEEISTRESEKGQVMFEQFLEFCQDYGIIDEFDGDAINALFEEREGS